MGWEPEVLRFVDLLGVFANALLGGVIARREKLDIIGFGVLAILSGLGGGMIRDMMLPTTIPVALLDNMYLFTAISAAVISYVIHIRGAIWERVFPLLDSLALGAWASAGTTKALAYGIDWLPAILLGVLTATGGGVVRDITMRRVPGVLGGNTLYATAAMAAAIVAIIGVEMGMPSVSMLASMITGAGLCLMARRFGWMLPDADAWSIKQVIPEPARRKLRETILDRRRRGNDDATTTVDDSLRTPPE